MLKICLAGEAVPIYIKQNDDEVHRIVKDNILKILSQDGVDDCKIMILSVTGAMREGKSFILNMFIRFLESGRSDNWMNSNETNLTGFSWRGGTKSNTMGILMWSKPYFSTLLDGTKVAIFLIDTQGAFDNENDLTQSSKIITMSLAISSHMIYNVNKCLRSDKLEFFEMFVEHARMAEGLHGKSFFQTLLFLIRDWPDRDEHSCGAKGGEIYVNEQLSRGSQNNVRKENFKKMFEQVGGFLLPHPGKKVAQSRQEQFNGAFEDISSDFRQHLDELVHFLFDPDKISLKKFNDKPIHGRELAEFALQFSKMLESDNLPTPKDFVEAQIEAAKNNLVIEFRNKFKSKMKQNMGESQFLKNTEFAQMAKSAENEIIAELEGRAFYGGDESKKEAMESVKLHIKNDIGEFSDRNLAIEAECRIDYDKYIDEKKKELSDILRKKFSHYVEEIKIKDSCKEYESVILGKHFDGIKRRVEDFEAEYTSKIKNMIKQLCDDVVLQNTNNLKVMQKYLDLQINDIYEEAKVKLSEILQQQNIKDSSQADLILKQIVDDTTEESVLADIPKTIFNDWKIKLRTKLETLCDLASTIITRNKENDEMQISEKLEELGKYFITQVVKLTNKKVKSKPQLEKIRQNSAEKAKKILSDMNLGGYIKNQCLERLGAILENKFKIILEENQQKEKCENDVKNEIDIKAIHKKIRLEALDKFTKAVSDGPMDLYRSSRENLKTKLNILLSETIEEHESRKKRILEKLSKFTKERRQQYTDKMKKSLDQPDPVELEDLKKLHMKCKSDTLKEYAGNSKGMPDILISEKKKDLNRMLEGEFAKLQKSNMDILKMQKGKEADCIQECIKIYNQEMEKACKDLMDDLYIEESHNESQQKSFDRMQHISAQFTSQMHNRVNAELQKMIREKKEHHRKIANSNKNKARKKSASILNGVKLEFQRSFERKTGGDACTEENLRKYFSEAEKKSEDYLKRMNISQVERQFCQQNLQDTFDKWKEEFRDQNKRAEAELHRSCKISSDKAKRIYRQHIKNVKKDQDNDDLNPHHYRANDEAMSSFDLDLLRGNEEIVRKYKIDLEEWIKTEWSFFLNHGELQVVQEREESVRETSQCNCCFAVEAILKHVEQIKSDIEIVKQQQANLKHELSELSTKIGK
ncbi:uncharacterized protein LOC120325414 [Styela clava]